VETRRLCERLAAVSRAFERLHAEAGASPTSPDRRDRECTVAPVVDEAGKANEKPSGCVGANESLCSVVAQGHAKFDPFARTEACASERDRRAIYEAQLSCRSECGNRNAERERSKDECHAHETQYAEGPLVGGPSDSTRWR
jgi:hypothetical protein